MAELEKARQEACQAQNVFLFIPNIIGYTRVLFAVVSCWFMQTNYVVAAWSYCLCVLLDPVDGHVARHLGQTSRFGAMLDLLTDRCAFICLLNTLSTFYPSCTFIFQLVMSLDLSSHWLHSQAALCQGISTYKFLDVTTFYWMQQYQTNRKLQLLLCVGKEVFYGSLYLLHFTYRPLYLFHMIAVFSFPVALAKSGIILLQGYIAAVNIVGVDLEERAAEKKDSHMKQCLELEERRQQLEDSKMDLEFEKLSQEKDEETSQLNNSLATALEEVALLEGQVADLSRGKDESLEKIENMTLDIEIKTCEILKLIKEKERIESENYEEITKYILEKKKLVMEQKDAITEQIKEKEQLEEDHARVVLKLTSESEAEVSKLSQAVLLVKEELEGREKVCRDLERKADDLKKDKEEVDDRIENMSMIIESKTKAIIVLTEEKKKAEDNKTEDIIKLNLEKEIGNMTRIMASKTKEILVLIEEKKINEDKNNEYIVKLNLEKEKQEEDHKKTIINLSACSQKEANKLKQALLLLLVKEASCRDFKKKLNEAEGRLENREEELQEEFRRRTEFRKKLERSFYSLQKQYQMKVDELDRVRKEIGQDPVQTYLRL